MPPRKKLPIGIQTFAIIRGEPYVYIDKTEFAWKLIDGGRYYFLSRPRRFGKSLLVDTLRCLFEGRRELFTGLWIADRWDWETRYPVLKISFGAGVTRDLDDLRNTFTSLLIDWSRAWGVVYQKPDLKGRFAETLSYIHEQTGQPVVVLVDEYDKPILDSLTDPEAARAIRDGLRDFYSVLKDSDEHLRFVLLTGVSKFSKVSLFSGLNHLRDITLDPDFSALCGYTQADLEREFTGWLDGVDRDKMREWYNGYAWLGESVYNPFDVLLFLQNRGQYRNWWFETGTPTFLVDLMREKRYFLPDLEALEMDERLLDSFEVDRIEVETLLFQTGYLTVRESFTVGQRLRFRLSYPNREVQVALSDVLLDMLTDQPARKSRWQDALYLALETGDLARFRDTLRAVFAAIPYNNFTHSRLHEYEGYYASVIYAYLASLGVELIAEDVTHRGRIDLTLKIPGRVYLFEFKVIENQPAGAPGALQQLQDRDYAAKYRGLGQPITRVGIEFSQASRNLERCDWAAG